MKRLLDITRVLASTAALLTLLDGTALALGGINLSWTDCGSAGVQQMTFSCASNTLTGAVLVASAVSGVDIPELISEESVMDLQVNQAALSPWWQLQTGGCRGTSGITSDFNFTSGPFGCLDPWQGSAVGGMVYRTTGPNRARIQTVGYPYPSGSTSINGTSEYEFFKIVLLGAKTVGNGSCAGCSDGACIVLNEIKLVQPLGVGDYPVTLPIVRNWALWQQGAATVPGGCPSATPARSATWGSVKSLYR